MEKRLATIEEMRAARPEGTKVSFEHAVYETARMQNGKWVTVHRSNSTAKIQYDAKGAFVMRKGQREDLKAYYVTCEGIKPFVAMFRASYLS